MHETTEQTAEGTSEENPTIVAIFENGVFRPLNPVNDSLEEGQRVQITISPPLSPDEMLKLATSVYAGLAEEEIEEIEKVILDRRSWFPDRDLV